ncbi:MAG TPA: porin [Panacibacter sp.]|nr:porin [Panacibacter sp.]
MLKKVVTSSALLISSICAISQTDSTTPAPATKISGYVDAYYRYNFNNPQESFNTGGTSFTNSQNSFQLGMASLKVEHSFGKVGVVADLGFGTRAKEFSYADADYLVPVKQAYVTYAPSDKVKFTMGKWGTHVGYELLDPALNKNYSMSYMFSYGPFSHTGIKADFTLGKGSGLMVGIANPIDVTAPPSAPTKTLLAQYSYVGSKFSAYLNYLGYFGAKTTIPNASNLSQFGLTMTATVSDKFSIGYDGTVQSVKDEEADKSKSWWGSALYFNYMPTDKFTLCLRTEYFGDEKYALKTGANIFQTTLSANFKVGNLLIIPELRLDNASQEIFEKKDGTTKSTATGILAVVYSF